MDSAIYARALAGYDEDREARLHGIDGRAALAGSGEQVWGQPATDLVAEDAARPPCEGLCAASSYPTNPRGAPWVAREFRAVSMDE